MPLEAAGAAVWASHTTWLGFQGGLLATVLILAYWPLLNSRDWAFILYYDDEANWVYNSFIHKLSCENLVSMWTESVVNVYEPVSWMVKAALIAVFGLDAHAPRIVSLVLHWLNALLLAGWTCAVLRKHQPHNLRAGSSECSAPLRAREAIPIFAAACVFALHPLHVEVVVWPSALPYAHALTAALLATWSFEHLLDRRQQQQLLAMGGATPSSNGSRIENHRSTLLLHAAVLMGFAIACLSKALAVMLFPVLVLQWLRHVVATADGVGMRKQQWDSSRGRLLPRELESCPVKLFSALASMAVAVVAMTMRANALGNTEHADSISLNAWSGRIYRAAFTVWTSSASLWYPVELRPHYRLDTAAMHLGNPAVLVSVVGVIVLAAVALLQALRRPVASAALLSYLLWWLPVCGLVQHGWITAGGDRYLYFGAAFATPWLAQGIADLAADRPAGKKNGSKAASGIGWYSRRMCTLVGAGACVCLVLSTFGWLTRQQIEVWRSDESLLVHSLRTDPDDWRAHDFLGHLLVHKQGKQERGHVHYEAFLRTLPMGTLKSFLDRSKTLFLLSRQEEACDTLRWAHDQFPPHAAVEMNLVSCVMRTSDPDRAQRAWEHVRAAEALFADPSAQPYPEYMYRALDKTKTALTQWAGGQYSATIVF